jgi:DNA-binding FadR family transcriptional regulator
MTLRRLERAPLLHQSVQDALKQYIVERRLRPGDPLPAEAEFARRLGVSRSSVREAVKALETIGIVESRRGSGVYVAAFSFDPLLESLPYGLMIDSQAIADLLDLRCTLEVALAERAIARRTPDQLADLEATLREFRSAAEAGASLEEADRQFHQVLARNLGNRVLVSLIDIFWRSFQRAAQSINLVNVDPLATYRDHVAIFESFAAGDVAATKVDIDRHFDGIRRLLRQQEGGPTTSRRP